MTDYQSCEIECSTAGEERTREACLPHTRTIPQAHQHGVQFIRSAQQMLISSDPEPGSGPGARCGVKHTPSLSSPVLPCPGGCQFTVQMQWEGCRLWWAMGGYRLEENSKRGPIWSSVRWYHTHRHTGTHTHVHSHACTHPYPLHTYKCTHAHTLVSTHAHPYTNTQVHTQMHATTHSCSHTLIPTCIPIYTHVDTHMHTTPIYTHTQMPRLWTQKHTRPTTTPRVLWRGTFSLPFRFKELFSSSHPSLVLLTHINHS